MINERVSFVAYFKNTGIIDQFGSCAQGELPLLDTDTKGAIQGEGDGNTHYVDLVTLEIKERQDYTIDALPLPCTVTIEGVEYECTDQPVFEFNYPGTYQIKVDAGPAYLWKTFDYDYQP